jgi:rRNA maturation protein Rpf1
LEVIKLFEQVNGRSFEVQFVPEEALQAQQAAASDPMQQSFSALMRVYATGDSIDMSATYPTFAVRPTRLEEYVRHILATA